MDEAARRDKEAFLTLVQSLLRAGHEVGATVRMLAGLNAKTSSEGKDTTMRELLNPKKYMDEHLKAAADRYVDGLQRAGLKNNEKLKRAVFRRALQETSTSYKKELDEAFHHNVRFILQDSRMRDRQIRREGASWGLKIFPIITLVLALLAWYGFWHGDPGLWIIYAVFSLVFFALSLSAIVNRWR